MQKGLKYILNGRWLFGSTGLGFCCENWQGFITTGGNVDRLRIGLFAIGREPTRLGQDFFQSRTDVVVPDFALPLDLDVAGGLLKSSQKTPGHDIEQEGVVIALQISTVGYTRAQFSGGDDGKVV